MKRKLFAFSLMCLLCVGAWAKNMTVRVVDHFDDPIEGLKVTLYEQNSSWNSDYASLTTNEKGEVTMNRTNMNFMNLSVNEQPYCYKEYEIIWSGGDETVEVKMENYAMFTFRWPGLTDELAEVAMLAIYGQAETLDWGTSKKVSLLLPLMIENVPLTWGIRGKVLGLPDHVIADASDPTARDITVEVSLENLTQMQVTVFNREGETGRVDFSLKEAKSQKELGNISTEGIYYAPAGDYTLDLAVDYFLNISQNKNSSSYYMNINNMKVSLQTGQLNQIDIDYRKANNLTVEVLGVDGNPMSNVEVFDYDISYWNRIALTGNDGKAHIFCFDGTYTFDVKVAFAWNGAMVEDEFEINATMAGQDQLHTVSLADKYSFVSIGLTLPDFMTDREKLSVRVWDNGQGKPAHYDEAAERYNVILNRKAEPDEYNSCPRYCEIEYPGMFTKHICIGNELETYENIAIDFVEYKNVVSFVSTQPEKHGLSDIQIEGPLDNLDQYVNFSMPDGINKLYMPDGRYSMKATVTDLSTGGEYPSVNRQEFNVAGKDMEVAYGINEDDYHTLTINVVDAQGKAMIGANVRIYTSYPFYYDESKLTDENGQAVFDLLPTGDDYDCIVNVDGYSQQEVRDFTLDADKELRISYEDYKVFSVRITGSLVSEFLATNSGSVDGELHVYKRGAGQTERIELNYPQPGDTEISTDPIFLPVGTYTCRLSSAFGPTILDEDFGTFELTGDKELEIELSSDTYHKVDFNVVDKDGIGITSGRFTIYEDKIHKYSHSLPFSAYYLPNGNYKATFNRREYAESTVVSATDFTVADADQTVTIVHEDTEMLDFKMKVKLPETARGYIDQFNMTFSMNGEDVGYSYFNINPETMEGEIETFLSAGTYDYSIHQIGKEGQFTLSNESQEIFLDFSNDPYVMINVTDEDGNPIEHVMLQIIQNGEYFDEGYNSTYFSFLPAGTYQLLAWGAGYKEVEQTITTTGTTQTFDIKLPKTNPDNFTVVFEVYDEFEDYSLFAKVALNDFGSHTGHYNLVFADIPAGSYPYTVEADGFETYTGTVEVNTDNAADIEDVGMPNVILVEVLMKEQKSTGITNSADGNESFRIFPTIAEDYVHIAPTADVEGSWTVRLVSASGMVVYADKHDMSAETVVPVAGLPKGLYLLCIDNGVDTEIYKVVKK